MKDWYEVGAEPARDRRRSCEAEGRPGQAKKAPKAPPPPTDDDDDDEEKRPQGQVQKRQGPQARPRRRRRGRRLTPRLVLARTHAPDVIADFQRGKVRRS